MATKFKDIWPELWGETYSETARRVQGYTDAEFHYMAGYSKGYVGIEVEELKVTPIHWLGWQDGAFDRQAKMNALYEE